MHACPRPYISMHSGPALTKGSTHRDTAPQNVHKPNKPPQTQRGEAQEAERTERVTLVVLMLPRGSLSLG